MACIPLFVSRCIPLRPKVAEPQTAEATAEAAEAPAMVICLDGEILKVLWCVDIIGYI